MIVLKGAEVSAKIQEQTADGLEKLKGGKSQPPTGLKTGEGADDRAEKEAEQADSWVPKLAIIRVGENPDDISYERGAAKKMEKFGLRVQSYTYAADISDGAFKAEFAKINADPDVTGILLLRPLPKQICEKDIEQMIDPEKDLDGISPVNIAKVFSGDSTGFAPCTAEAVVEVLKANRIPIEGKRVVIVGRSMVVGKPLAMLMLKENATVTVCHTRTKDLKDVCRNAEILVAAAGRARMLNQEYVGQGAVVIDVGINADENGKLCGDVDYESIQETASMATPVPGGVGAVTTAVLAKHLVRAAENRR